MDPLTLALIMGGGSLAGGILNMIPGLGPGAKNLNQDYQNNPIWQRLFGAGGGADNAQKGMESFLANAVSTSKSYDPTAFWKDFMAAQPEMQGLISGPVNSFKSAAEGNLADFVKQATSETSSQLSGMGALYSGAFGDILGTKVGGEARKAGTDLASMQAGLLGQLYGSSLPLFSGNRQFGTSSLVSTYLGGADMYQRQLAQMLGIGADLSSPVYQPTPGMGDILMSGMGSALTGYATGLMGQGSSGKPAAKKPDNTGLFNAPPVGVGAAPWYPGM